MRNLVLSAGALALALSIGVGTASAREISGTITSISPALPYLTLSNGQSFKLGGAAQAAWCGSAAAVVPFADTPFQDCASSSGGPKLRVGEHVSVISGKNGVADQIMVR